MTISDSELVNNSPDINSQPNDYKVNSNLDHAKKYNDTSGLTKISLLEEKLQVTRRKQKVGEVIVRKEVETRIIKIPIRREKLVIERVGINPEKITEVIVNQEKVNGFKYDEIDDTNSLHLVRSKYLDLQTAQDLLDAIASLSAANNAKIRLEIVTNSAESQQQHQDVCDRFINR
ncbi:DUF2382 domain-containing protein [Waterburya agarophytonicola K14]|uniref:DUF2382 domain-containing protein n=1 Tax=Waterburya agarophytonicola KI4 TaxID=2874699 RepID=A0A964BPE1_9CYAN|nr:DUF2382 domain-containing protein [Waterburya agarophytonicola]MCC0176829.1 DUF2382 domain-containing protein [Waterburya agarophytonicola KI4]